MRRAIPVGSSPGRGARTAPVRFIEEELRLRLPSQWEGQNLRSRTALFWSNFLSCMKTLRHEPSQMSTKPPTGGEELGPDRQWSEGGGDPSPRPGEAGCRNSAASSNPSGTTVFLQAGRHIALAVSPRGLLHRITEVCPTEIDELRAGEARLSAPSSCWALLRLECSHAYYCPLLRFERERAGAWREALRITS